MEKQRQPIDLRILLYSVFLFVWMARGEITSNASSIDPTGVWQSPKDAFLKFEESPDNNFSAILFIKSKGFFNLTGTKSAFSENGTFYLNSVQSKYVIGITGQFLICDDGMNQLQVVLQIGINRGCDFDIFSRNSIHSFFRANESLWSHLESECSLEENKHDDDDDDDVDDGDDDDTREITADSNQAENCTLSGFWVNRYGSTMNLTVDDTGKITGFYHTVHERAEGTSGSGLTSLQGWKGDNSMFTFSMIWNSGTSVTTFLGISHNKNGTCRLWTDFALVVAQKSCADSWQFCILSSYNTWKKLL